MESGNRTGTALVFPGMGPSRFADVGKFMLANRHARRLVAAAGERLGYSLTDRFRQAEGDYSEYAQVAFFVNCLALAQWAEEELGVRPDVCTGPSFGEKPAVAYAQSLSFEDAVWMTARLARLLEDYFAGAHQDVVTHSFVRTPKEKVEEMLADLTARGEWSDISCHVDEDFYMVSLRERNLEWLDGRIRAMGGMSLYSMRPPMHSAAFGELRRRAEEEVIGGLEFHDPKLPVVADQDGTVLRTADEVKAMLLDGFVRPLRWPDVVGSLRDLGVGKVVVSGPDTLFGRVGCTTRNFEVLAVGPRLAMQPRRRGTPAA
ncbi:ACP S-malonyltransferase [Streptomyces kutzneri]|uniref:ACP S-malonyltransferase n=1 Tax=Streptomyces kutzneri TaxID=3051179 RepID=UPI0028D3CC96|nr:ACP S-malonyltransferase [Streptomyces sp. DSM 40907]